MNDVTIPSIAPTAANDDDGDDANMKLFDKLNKLLPWLVSMILAYKYLQGSYNSDNIRQQ